MCAASSLEIYLRSSALICGCFPLYSRLFASIRGYYGTKALRAYSPHRRFAHSPFRFSTLPFSYATRTSLISFSRVTQCGEDEGEVVVKPPAERSPNLT